MLPRLGLEPILTGRGPYLLREVLQVFRLMSVMNTDGELCHINQRMLNHIPEHRREGRGRDLIVAIHKHQIISTGLGYAVVAGIRKSAVGFVEDTHGHILGTDALGYESGGIGTAVINKDNLGILRQLCQDALQTSLQRISHIIAGNNYRKTHRQFMVKAKIQYLSV